MTNQNASYILFYIYYTILAVWGQSSVTLSPLTLFLCSGGAPCALDTSPAPLSSRPSSRSYLPYGFACPRHLYEGNPGAFIIWDWLVLVNLWKCMDIVACVPGFSSLLRLSNLACVGMCCPLLGHSSFNGRVIASALGTCDQCRCDCGVHVPVSVPALSSLTSPRIAGSYADPCLTVLRNHWLS